MKTKQIVANKFDVSFSCSESNAKVYTETESDSYTYDETWKDKLTSFNGQTISYDASGNPTNYLGHNLSWTMGRQLASFDGITYTYNEDGIRTAKVSNGFTTKYYLNGSNIIYQTNGIDDLYFFYDNKDNIVGFSYAGNNYFYVKNQQGDINDIANSDGEVVASYEYDTWGKVVSVTGDVKLGNLNPFRYRSYYYDSDIQMYYLQSRYYDPEVGRFINCDDVNYIGITESEVSYNPFAYCENDPVNCWDPNGNRNYAVIPKNKNSNWEYITKQAIQIYKASNIYRMPFLNSSCYKNGHIYNIKIPLFKFDSSSVNIKKKLFKLNYVSAHFTTSDDKYSVVFGLMTKTQWEAYLLGIDGRKLSRKIKNIKNYIDQMKVKYAVTDEVIEKVLDASIMFTENLAMCLTGSPASLAVEGVSKALEVIKKYGPIVGFCLDYAIDKMKIRLTKEEKYIMSTINNCKISNSSVVMILMRRLDYVYTQRGYQSGVFWVCQKGWFLKNTAYPF